MTLLQVLFYLGLLVVGWMLKDLYDWKIHSWIVKKTKTSEKEKAEKEEREKKEKQAKIDNLNRIWKTDRGILNDLKQPLKEFNQMNRFPDDYKAPKCLELATYIETEALRIESPRFKEIKDKLLEYAGRRNKIDQNTPLDILMAIFQKPVEPNLFEPLFLVREIDKVLEASSTPPYSEKDL